MGITLYVEPNFISPYVFSCWLTLTEKELAFDVAVLDANKGETRDASYLARTVTGRVPALEHDGFAMAESSAIVEYLEDRFPDPAVMPKAPHARARCRQLMSWMRSDETAPVREERPTTTMFYERATAPLSPKAEAAAKKIVEVAERVLKPEAATLFDAWSIADADLAFLLHRLILNGDPVSERLRVWATEQWRRPTVAAFVTRDRPRR